MLSEGSARRIKRYKRIGDKTKWQRYPAKDYVGLEESDVEALLRRLNATYEGDRKAAEERYNFDHAYINLSSIAAFERHLTKRATDSSHVKNTVQMLQSYVLEFFVLQHKMPDPSRWHLKEDAWGEWLGTQALSVATLKKVVSTANRFTKFLVQKVYPEMDTPRALEPIGKARFEAIEKDLARKRKSKYISQARLNEILSHAAKTAPAVVPNIKLCYAFGLRISETLGLTKEKFFKGGLLVDEQGSRFAEDGSLARKVTKKAARRVPYWNMTAKEAWSLVQCITPMHPDTLIRKVNACLEKFGHTSHDFRRSFITNSFRVAPHWKDVMRAAGHTDVRTTMGYDQDDRNISEEKAELD